MTDLLSGSAPKRTGNLAGQLAGGSFPEPLDVTTRLVFASPENLSSVIYALSNVDYSPDGGFSSAMQWSGPATTSGAVYALQFASASSVNGYLPVQYLGFGSLSGVSLDDMGSLGGQTVMLAPI